MVAVQSDVDGFQVIDKLFGLLKFLLLVQVRALWMWLRTMLGFVVCLRLQLVWFLRKGNQFKP